MHLITAFTDDSFIFHSFFFSPPSVTKENCSTSLPIIFTEMSSSRGSYNIWCCTNLYLGLMLVSEKVRLEKGQNAHTC